LLRPHRHLKAEKLVYVFSGTQELDLDLPVAAAMAGPIEFNNSQAAL
jgi:hypothetical protein